MKITEILLFGALGYLAYKMLSANRQTIYRLPSGENMVYQNGQLVPLSTMFPNGTAPTVTIQGNAGQYLVYENGQLVPIDSVFR